MNTKEKEAVVNAITAMSDEEKKIALTCIPVQMMLEHIKYVFDQQEMFIDTVKNAFVNIS